jgi:hypothetical protein
MTRSSGGAIVLVIAACVACGGTTDTAAGVVGLEHVQIVTENKLVRLGDLTPDKVSVDQLTGLVLPGLAGSDLGASPLAAPIDDGHVVMLVRPTGSNRAGPLASELDVVEMQSGRSTVLASRAYSFAVSEDGRLAYTEPSTPDGEQALTVISVRGSVTGVDETWVSTSDRYVVLAWANDRLLFLRSNGESGTTELMVADGPDQLRVLASPGGLVAVAPDGDRAIVAIRSADGGTTSTILNVSTGARAGTVTAGAASDTNPELVSASWTDHGVAGVVSDGRRFGLALASATSAGVEVDAPIWFEPQVAPVIVEPFLGADGGVIGGVSPNGVLHAGDYPAPEAVSKLVTCTLSDRRCSETLIPGRGQSGRLYNPSRPGGHALAIEES